MRRQAPDLSIERAREQRLSRDGHAPVGSLGVTILVLGWSSIVLAHRAGGVFDDPASHGALVLTAVVVVVSLIAVAAGCAISISAAESPTRHVFHSRPAFWTAVILLLGGAAIAVALIVREPFDRITTHGQFTAYTVGDVGCVVASIASFVGGGVAVLSCWDARLDERNWHRSRLG